MKITGLKSTILSVPFSKPTFWPYGRWDGMTVVVIEIETDVGVVGIGESVCLQSPAEVFKGFIDSSKPFLIGEDPFNAERIGKKIEGLGGLGLRTAFRWIRPRKPSEKVYGNCCRRERLLHSPGFYIS